jgi:hypothetical protein
MRPLESVLGIVNPIPTNVNPGVERERKMNILKVKLIILRPGIDTTGPEIEMRIVM